MVGVEGKGKREEKGTVYMDGRKERGRERERERERKGERGEGVNHGVHLS